MKFLISEEKKEKEKERRTEENIYIIHKAKCMKKKEKNEEKGKEIL